MTVANAEVMADEMPRERSSATLPLSGDQAEALERMMAKAKQTRTELIRRGLQLLGEELGIEFPVRLRLL